MRIGINCFLLRPEIGGIKQYFYNLFRYLQSEKTEHAYIFFYCEANKEELSKILPPDDTEHAVFLTRQREIRHYLDRIDVYFCPFGSLYPRPLPIPTVVMIVDIQEVFFPRFFSVRQLLERAYHYRGSTAMADQVITISQFTKETIVVHHGVHPKKITVTHLCADPRFYNPEKYARMVHKSIPASFILYPANLWRHKNHDLLLRAIAWLKNTVGNRVNVVLTGYEQKNGYPLASKIRQYGLDGQVYSLGYVSVEELIYLYGKADLLVFPSLFEGFGIPLVEAMASGCPILASGTSSLPEVGGDCVRYFNPNSYIDLGEKLNDLLDDADLRAELKKSGFQRVQEFSMDRMAAKHLRAFSEAIEGYSYTKYLYNKYLNRYILGFRFLVRAIFIICSTYFKYCLQLRKGE